MPEELSAAELAAVLGTERAPALVDVREPHEVAAWSIPGVVNVPLGELPARAGELPRDRPIVVVCARGNRSRRAAELLAAEGLRVANLIGGMEAWGRVYDTATVDAGGVQIVQVRRRGKGCLSYLIGSGGEAFAIDPSIDVAVYLELARDAGWRITRVFDTHLHADHLSGAPDLAARTGASLHLNGSDPFRFAFTPLSDGDRFALPDGESMSVAVLHTPGHTEGSTLFFIGAHVLLSGDTLFVDGVGRPDLAERSEQFARNLHRSLQDKVLSLPDSATVLPAHYGETVAVLPHVPVSAALGTLRTSLLPLSFDADDFVAWATTRVTPRPPNYVQIIKANIEGVRGGGSSAPRELETGPNRCSA